MADVVWTPQARADLAAVEDYYVEVAPAYADIVVDGLLGSVRRLATFPLSGRSVPEIADPAIREVVWREYRVIYWADEAHVEVLTVLHTSQQFGAA
ncbi:type II toxin-antitoxin system RelE/ParE family toxin [Rubrivirga sp. S365]|uniref:Type II toxin-antitoxin system RelE/ParE family toxin n=1 Tax=Rubrivirga litoralis TaxID=3075598 RepID=A0ABU3BM88_9BACT|nr:MULTISPECIES: type II toxin-antitoxin system RelE/ParE family toxin [unclassified Rubrivirga]MDT0630373.1 type II toxin-antitoxin system RelE/ParE family toxin [Rubrivirga sp. F394]MDT7855884.1 type II toxin-antitoxin system RelE/ParE family toxin [Rubrivirga sp. S365]